MNLPLNELLFLFFIFFVFSSFGSIKKKINIYDDNAIEQQAEIKYRNFVLAHFSVESEWKNFDSFVFRQNPNSVHYYFESFAIEIGQFHFSRSTQ